jgi:hypothetical protein
MIAASDEYNIILGCNYYQSSTAKVPAKPPSSSHTHSYGGQNYSILIGKLMK